ncbi:MAG: hypothetical protein JWQ43_251 [Glaciihabitans sp.]|nr:hypothetical protein [Glaciihabitans sp.]
MKTPRQYSSPERHSPQHCSAAIASAIAVVVSITSAVLMLLAPEWFALSGEAGAIFAGNGLSATLVAFAVLQLLAPSLRGGTALRAAILLSAVLAFAALYLAAVSWSIGFDEADAGLPTSPLASLVLPALGTGILLLALALGTTSLALRSNGVAALPVAARVAVVIPTSIVVAAILSGMGIAPITMCLVSAGVFITSVILAARDNRSAIPVAAPSTTPDLTTLLAIVSRRAATRARVDRPLAVRRATVLAWSSLAMSLAIWGGGVVTSIRLAGSPGATDALGVATGAGTLAAVPLILSITTIVVARTPERVSALWGAALAASVVVAVCAAALTIFYNVDGELMFALMPVTGIAVGAWLSTLVWPALTLPMAGRVASAVVFTVVGAVAYAACVSMIGGASLVVVSVLLLVWAARAFLLPKPVARSIPRPIST